MDKGIEFESCSSTKRKPQGEVAGQPEGEVARRAKNFRPTQPIPNPIRDRSGRFGITHDVISVQACSSEDSKSLNVEQTHDRSGRPGENTVVIQDDPEVYHEAKTLNTDTDNSWKNSGRHGLQNSRTTTFYCEEARAKCWHFLRKVREENQNLIKYTMDFLSIPDYYKKDDLTDTDTVRNRETRNTTSPTSWRRSARRGTSRVSMTSLYEMNNSAVEWFKLVETKIFVDKWMILRTKITPTIWPQKNISTTKVIGGFVRSVDLTSNKHCLPCSNWKNKKKLNETNDGHRVLLHGGIGKVLGGPLVPMKVTMKMDQVLIEQGDLLCKFLEQFFKAWFSWIHLLCYRWIV